MCYSGLFVSFFMLFGFPTSDYLSALDYTFGSVICFEPYALVWVEDLSIHYVSHSISCCTA